MIYTGYEGTLGSAKSKNKILLIIKSHYVDEVNKITQEICSILKQSAVDFSGPVMLPRQTKRFTLLTSPHVDKDSRQVIAIDTVRRMIQIPRSQRVMSIISALSDLVDKNTYVSIQVKMKEEEVKK